MRRIFWGLVVAVLASPVLAQEEDAQEEPDAKKILFDLSFDHDPRELYPKFTEPRD